MRVYLVESRTRVEGVGRWSRWRPFDRTFWSKKDAQAWAADEARNALGSALHQQFRATAWEKAASTLPVNPSQDIDVASP